jgi:hypothetical protein
MMYPLSVRALQADALFASALQRSDELSVSQIRRVVATALHGYGAAGCAGLVAQEFGDHPETAAVRMRWARCWRGGVTEVCFPSMPWAMARREWVMINSGQAEVRYRWCCRG